MISGSFQHGIEYKITVDGIYTNITKYFRAMNIFDSSIPSSKAYKTFINSAKNTSEMTIKELKYYISLLKSLDIQEEYVIRLKNFINDLLSHLVVFCLFYVE